MTVTAVVSLTEFLTARLDEDEAAARAAGLGVWESVADLSACNGPGITSEHGDIVDEWHVDADVAPHIVRHDPARVLREVEAKRAIVRIHGRVGPHDNDPDLVGTDGCVTCDYDSDCAVVMTSDDGPCRTTLALAAVYADHPDYREEWRA